MRSITYGGSATIMTAKQFFDWQTSGGTDDVMRLVDCLERADIAWCAIGGVAVNHWAEEPMVTQDVDFVVATEAVDRTVSLLEDAGFKAERFDWSINFKGHSKVSIQLSTEEFYREFPARAVAADVHGILLRVASLEDTLHGKMEAYSDPKRTTKQADQGSRRYRPAGGIASGAVGASDRRSAAATRATRKPVEGVLFRRPM